MVPESAMRAFEEAANEHIERFNEEREEAFSLACTSTLWSQRKQRPNYRPALILHILPGGKTEVCLLATFGKTPYEDIYENTRDLVVPIANRVVSAEDLPVESIQTRPVWPFPFEYAITRSIIVSELRHRYPDNANRYWVEKEDLKKLTAIGAEQARQLTTKLQKYEGGANEWLKDIRREARKVSYRRNENSRH